MCVVVNKNVDETADIPADLEKTRIVERGRSETSRLVRLVRKVQQPRAAHAQLS